MASRQEKKKSEQVEDRKPAAEEKTLEHQEHFAEGRSHGGEIKTGQVRNEGYPETGTQTMIEEHGVSPTPAQQGIDVDESTG